jgi:hypothetical protein
LGLLEISQYPPLEQTPAPSCSPFLGFSQGASYRYNVVASNNVRLFACKGQVDGIPLVTYVDNVCPTNRMPQARRKEQKSIHVSQPFGKSRFTRL